MHIYLMQCCLSDRVRVYQKEPCAALMTSLAEPSDTLAELKNTLAALHT